MTAGCVHGRYALREAREITRAEGLEALWKRHNEVHQRLWAGLKPLGLQPFVAKDDDRLISVNTILVRLALAHARFSCTPEYIWSVHDAMHDQGSKRLVAAQCIHVSGVMSTAGIQACMSAIVKSHATE